MRPDLEKVIKEGGLDAAIEFLKNVGDCGIHLAKHETDALVKLIDDFERRNKMNKEIKEPEEWIFEMKESRKENVVKDGKMFNETWQDVTDDYIERVKKCLSGCDENRFSIGYVADVIKNEVGQDIPNEYEHSHKVIYIHGGKNGNGDWVNYMMDVTSIIFRLSKEFKNVYLIKWDVDVADDVFYIWIGVE